MEDPKKPTSQQAQPHTQVPNADDSHSCDKSGTPASTGSSVPPHSAGEGAHSSSSSTAAQGTTPQAPQAMPPTKAGKVQAKAGAATKRRRTSQSAGPTVGPRTHLEEPAEMVPENGWGDTNKALFKEWEIHFEAMVKTSPHYHPDDAAGLIRELQESISARHEAIQMAAVEEQRQHAWKLDQANYFQATLQHPMPRPEQPPPASLRWSPFTKSP